MKQFKKVVIGGTFDLLHLGHKKLLKAAFDKGQSVSIGLTTDKFNSRRNKNTFENQTIREDNLKKYLLSQSYQNFQIHPINDIFGSADTESSLEAMIVTEETYKNALLINQRRRLSAQFANFASGLGRLHFGLPMGMFGI